MTALKTNIFIISNPQKFPPREGKQIREQPKKVFRKNEHSRRATENALNNASTRDVANSKDFRNLKVRVLHSDIRAVIRMHLECGLPCSMLLHFVGAGRNRDGHS